MRKLDLSPDFWDMLLCLNEVKARYIVVGGYAMAVHGYIRATGDLDIFVEPERENAQRVYSALVSFGAPLNNVVADDFMTPGMIYQMGLPPFRIDVITYIDGVSFKEAVNDATWIDYDKGRVPFLSLVHIIRNKLATGREKDAIDAHELQSIQENKNNGDS